MGMLQEIIPLVLIGKMEAAMRTMNAQRKPTESIMNRPRMQPHSTAAAAAAAMKSTEMEMRDLT